MEYTCDSSNRFQIKEHLDGCNLHFVPPLATKVSIDEYASKLANLARKFEVWNKTVLVGLIALYHDQSIKRFYITNVSVLPSYQGEGIATKLLEIVINAARKEAIEVIALEVGKTNKKAIRLYKSHGFKNERETEESYFLTLEL